MTMDRKSVPHYFQTSILPRPHKHYVKIEKKPISKEREKLSGQKLYRRVTWLVKIHYEKKDSWRWLICPSIAKDKMLPGRCLIMN